MPSSSDAPGVALESAAAFEEVLEPAQIGPAEGLRVDCVPVAARLRPSGAEQLAACLAVAARAGIAVVPRGGGTKLEWGNLTRAKSLVSLELSALAGEPEIAAAEGVASVPAGASVEDLEVRCRAQGRAAWIDGIAPGASVGGCVATDPLGCAGSLERRLRGELLGLEVALPNGTLARCGGRVVKNVTGFDLVRLHCGASGTLGVITRVELRLRPCPEVERILGFEFASAALAIAEAQRRLALHLPHAGVAVEPSGRLIWRLEGTTAGVEATRAELGGGDELGEKDWEPVRARRAGEPASESAAYVRISARPSDLGAIAAELAEIAGESALELALPAAGTAFARVSLEALDGLRGRCDRAGWLAVVERAPLAYKKLHDVFPSGPELPLARALKQRFDPEGVLAPGRFWGRI